jgi:hypothetical protein
MKYSIQDVSIEDLRKEGEKNKWWLDFVDKTPSINYNSQEERCKTILQQLDMLIDDGVTIFNQEEYLRAQDTYKSA